VTSVAPLLGRLVDPAIGDLAAQLRALGTLSGAEQEAVHEATAAAVRDAAWHRVCRVALLELNAARVTGALTAGDPRARWDQWVARLTEPGGWESLAAPYPTLLPRIRKVIDNRCRAALALARRFGRDRHALTALLGDNAGPLIRVVPGAGDSHHGGQSVSLLHCTGGTVVYKPRSVAVDATLARLLPRLLPDEPALTRIRVPAVLARDDQDGAYGWAAHVAHRHCESDDELRSFYRGLGHWIAVMRMLAGSDLHFENVVAAGPVPVVVDCETLFTPHVAPRVSGYGAALDFAVDRIGQSVLRIGLLPARMAALGYRGGDPSGAGRLPGEQPDLQVPTVVDLGTDHARVVMRPAKPLSGTNLPSAEPQLSRFWPDVVEAFSSLSTSLRARDDTGELAPMVAEFADCPVRVILRDTAGYTELERMLWHPRSLHRPQQAVQRVTELLVRQAENRPGAPDDPAVIGAEVAELLDGDVPVFTTTGRSGVLTGPRGTRWGRSEDLIESALDRWRASDLATDRQVVQASLVGAYLNDGWRPTYTTHIATIRTGDLDRRRRALAAGIVQRVSDTAIRGDDGTVTWVAPVLDVTGWAVRPLGPDIYGGISGVAVLLAAYQHEVTNGRADEVPGLDGLLKRAVESLRLLDDQQERDRWEASEAKIKIRPDPSGGYLGLGSRIWAWLLLHHLAAVDGDEAARRAAALATLLTGAVEFDETRDLLAGAAGAVVPVLQLARHTGDGRWRDKACELGDTVRRGASRSASGAFWPEPAYPGGIGGLSHGATGYGWALARLALATSDPEADDVAAAAFAWEEHLYDRQRRGWRDARAGDGEVKIASAWCHGAVGIGVAAADLRDHGWRRNDDLLADTLMRAAGSTAARGFGSTHTLCHGDLSAWEVLERACAAGCGPPGFDREATVARILTGMEEHGPVTNVAQEVFSPALLPGLGGTAYQLLRMDPHCRLPSVLLPDPPAGPDDVRTAPHRDLTGAADG
jgi:type 2 lantibiotic biosynthesis protein LanM